MASVLLALRKSKKSNQPSPVSAAASAADGGVPPAKAPEAGSSDVVKEYLQMWTGLGLLYAADYFSKQVGACPSRAPKRDHSFMSDWFGAPLPPLLLKIY